MQWEETIWAIIRRFQWEDHFWKLTERFSSATSMVTILYRKQEQKEQIRKIWCKRIGVLLLTGIVVIMCMVFSRNPQENRTIQNGNVISRDDQGKEVTFDFLTNVDGKQKKETMVLYLEDREFTMTELKKLDNQCLNYLNTYLKGANSSLDSVSTSLNLVSEVPNTGITISWILPENYIKEDGMLDLSEIPDKEITTKVIAQARWRNWEKEYTFPVTIKAQALPQGEYAVNQIQNVLLQKVEEQCTQKQIALPTKIGNYEVQYKDTEKEKSPPVYLLFGIVFFLFPILWKKEEHDNLEKRQQQLKLDYPEFINKSMLLFNAGLTIRGCFERLGEEYQRNIEKGGERRYVYEEVLAAHQEMTNGASEAAAIEHFGKRCRQLCYLRYASIINQNMKKGTEGFIALLEAEASDAFEKRKELSRQMGETAGTKLLLPMMLMFGIVIAIVIMPAFMTM